MEILCDPGWCVRKSDVQNKWDDNTHTLVYMYVSMYIITHSRVWINRVRLPILLVVS